MKHTVTITINDTDQGRAKINFTIDPPAGDANTAALQLAVDFMELIGNRAAGAAKQSEEG